MNDFQEMIDYYREQGAPGDQQMVIALLREMQEACGGALNGEALKAAAEAYGLKENMLAALIRRIPSLRMADAPHRLELCGTCPRGRELRAWVENTWHIRSGSTCEQGGFSYHVTPCMKNCKNGPSLKWDGTLYSQATVELIRKLTGMK